MPSVRRALQHSVDATCNPEMYSERSHDIGWVSNPVKRTGLFALHAVATRYPAQVAGLFGLEYTPDLEEFSAGTQSTVYRFGKNKLLKIVEASSELGTSDRRDLARQMEDEHLVLRKYLDDLVVPHTVTVGPHPIDRQREVVKVIQDFRKIIDPGIFTIDDPMVNRVAALAVRTAHPDNNRRMQRLVEDGIDMYLDKDLIPDTNGTFNLGLEPSGLLVMIDSQPVSDQHPAVQDIILNQLEDLARAA